MATLQQAMAHHPILRNSVLGRHLSFPPVRRGSWSRVIVAARQARDDGAGSVLTAPGARRADGLSERSVLYQRTESFIAFTALARTPLLAGFAANFCFSLVKGLIPSRAGRAGFLTTTNLAKPGAA